MLFSQKCLLAVFITAGLLFPVCDAQAQTPVDSPTIETPAASDALESDNFGGGGSLVVTSIEGCLKKLSPEAAEEVRLHFEKPYQECQQRLQRLEQKKRTEKPEETVADIPEDMDAATTEARSFVRVQRSVRETGFSPQKPDIENKMVSTDKKAAQTNHKPAPVPSVPDTKPLLNSFTYNR